MMMIDYAMIFYILITVGMVLLFCFLFLERKSLTVVCIIIIFIGIIGIFWTQSEQMNDLKIKLAPVMQNNSISDNEKYISIQLECSRARYGSSCVSELTRYFWGYP